MNLFCLLDGFRILTLTLVLQIPFNICNLRLGSKGSSVKLGAFHVYSFLEGAGDRDAHIHRPQVTLGWFNLPHPALGSIGQSGYQNHVGSNSILLRVALALGSPTVYDLRIPKALKLYIKEGTLSSDLSCSSQL